MTTLRARTLAHLDARTAALDEARRAYMDALADVAATRIHSDQRRFARARADAALDLWRAEIDAHVSALHADANAARLPAAP
jgi:hypothetical protein